MIEWLALAGIGLICGLFLKLPAFGFVSVAVVAIFVALGWQGAATVADLIVLVVGAAVVVQAGYLAGFLIRFGFSRLRSSAAARSAAAARSEGGETGAGEDEAFPSRAGRKSAAKR